MHESPTIPCPGNIPRKGARSQIRLVSAPNLSDRFATQDYVCPPKPELSLELRARWSQWSITKLISQVIHRMGKHFRRAATRCSETNASRGRQRNAEDSYQWLPWTLQWPFLLGLCLFSLAFGTLLVVLSTASLRENGLCDNRAGALFFFTWRFLPTTIAVIFSFMVMMLRNDIRRTEAFARLSRPGGATAESTLFLSNGVWWNDTREAWSKWRNGGHRSWALLAVSFLNFFAIVLISPLSAGVFALVDVSVS